MGYIAEKTVHRITMYISCGYPILRLRMLVFESGVQQAMLSERTDINSIGLGQFEEVVMKNSVGYGQTEEAV